MRFIQVFQRATTYMSSSSYPTLCASLQQYTLIIKHVNKMLEAPEVQELPSLKTAVERCLTKLLKFFDKSTFESEYYFFATVLDPRYKLWIFDKHPDLFESSWIEGCRSSLIDSLAREYDDDDDLAITSCSVPSKRSATELDEWEKEMSAMLPADDIVGISVDEELATYLAEARNRMEPLDWWRINAGRFPRLARMARDFLAIPGEFYFIPYAIV